MIMSGLDPHHVQIAPLANALLGEAKKQTAFATSSGVPRRPRDVALQQRFDGLLIFHKPMRPD